ncbi:uncharacterized protein LOC111619462 [Centruroides sculpturatus]|uniref:uncharacterized protein LOC111619462 n=1 Tax=Centruroides sculpturatus TaxID=218467 RepID=UPI000C6E315F|nr:uncharacterized protein LOC111619462 [Centruroides sculpturatus]
MKTFIIFACFTFVLSFAEMENTEDLTKVYCSSSEQLKIRVCVIENRADMVIDIFRNCVNKIAFYNTVDEMSEFVCGNATDEQYAEYRSCFDSGMMSENLSNPNFLKIIKLCLSRYT